MPRTKTLLYDGVEFVIAPLTLDQFDEMLDENEKIGTAPEDRIAKEKHDKMIRARGIKTLVLALNNASPNADRPWNAERVRAEIDPYVFLDLQANVLKLSRMKADDVREGEGLRSTPVSSVSPSERVQ